MLKNYFHIAFRNLLKNKLQSGINILGLSLGMAVAILVVLYVRNETSYDNWINHHEQVYRVYRHWSQDGQIVWTPGPLAETLRQDFPEVVSAAGLVYEGEVLLEKDSRKFYVEKVAMADSTFFSVVELPFLFGDPQRAFVAPNSVVLSQRVAELLLGAGNVLGQTIRINDEKEYTVTGILAPLAGNTHLDYEVYGQIDWENPSWTGNNRATYVRLSEQALASAFEEKMTAQINQRVQREFLAYGYTPDDIHLPTWKLQPFDEIHLHANQISWVAGGGGNVRHLYFLGLLGFLVLLIACMNYVNLATAQATQRAREVGVRKVSGAFRQHLMGQFLIESMVQSLLAMVAALALAELFLPAFNAITQRDLQFFSGEPQTLIFPLVLLALLVGVLAGAYPAFLLSRYQPTSVLKRGSEDGKSGTVFRRTLVVTQFSITIVLIIVMSFIFRQVNFMLDQELGFAADQVLVVPMNLEGSYLKAERLRDAFLQLPGVREMSTASRLPGQFYPDWGAVIEGREEKVAPRVAFVGLGYDQVIGLEMAEGRFFSNGFPTDTLSGFVVNESFVKEYRLTEPLGKRVRFSSEESFGQIIGVVKDFHYLGLDRPVYPLLMAANQERWYATFKVGAQDLDQTIDAIKALWARVEPAHPLRYTFLDDDFARQYESHERLGKTLLYATVLAIFIAMLGLFGLATFAANRRTKEIGIRKILGASAYQLTVMLIRDFTRWVLVAGLIALPIAYLLSQRWLEDFAYRTNLSPWPFILAVLISLAVAVLTVGFQSIRAALSNPVEALKYE